jgi:hypothetical protein
MKGNSWQQPRFDQMLSNLESGTSRGITQAITILRTAYWFERLRADTDRDTAYALGKHLQPATYRKNAKGDAYHHNLWPKYASGKHAPSPALLDEIDRQVPGSKGHFRHALFDAVELTTDLGRGGDELLQRLHPSVQHAVFQRSALKHRVYRRRASLARTLAQLEPQGDLEALAAGVVLLREAQEARADERAFQIGESLYRMLVIACTGTQATFVRAELALLVLILILPLAESRGRRFVPDLAHFLRSCDRLNTVILGLEDSNQIGGARKDCLRAMRRVLHGDFGDDLRFGLMAKLAPAVPLDTLCARSRFDLHRNAILTAWGWDALRSGKVEQFLPTAVLDEMGEVPRRA